MTVGVVPVRPDPGFGYIQPASSSGPRARRVARFVEKPDRARAEAMVRDGYLWNSGIFVWRAGDFLDEIDRTHAGDRAAPRGAPDDLAAFFGAVEQPIAVDVGVMERSARVLVLPGDFGWDDVGTWAALKRVRACDEHGNATERDRARPRSLGQRRARGRDRGRAVRRARPRRGVARRAHARHDDRAARRI